MPKFDVRIVEEVAYNVTIVAATEEEARKYGEDFIINSADRDMYCTGVLERHVEADEHFCRYHEGCVLEHDHCTDSLNCVYHN